MTENNVSPQCSGYRITQSEICRLREKADLMDDLYPASAHEIRKICNRVENRGYSS